MTLHILHMHVSIANFSLAEHASKPDTKSPELVFMQLRVLQALLKIIFDEWWQPLQIKRIYLDLEVFVVVVVVSGNNNGLVTPATWLFKFSPKTNENTITWKSILKLVKFENLKRIKQIRKKLTAFKVSRFDKDLYGFSLGRQAVAFQHTFPYKKGKVWMPVTIALFTYFPSNFALLLTL